MARAVRRIGSFIDDQLNSEWILIALPAFALWAAITVNAPAIVRGSFVLLTILLVMHGTTSEMAGKIE